MKAVKGSGMTREEVIKFVKPYNIFTQLFRHQIERSTQGYDCVVEVGRNHLPISIKVAK